MKPLPLVLVHGFMGGSDQWDLQRQTLGANRQLITPDLPGFGKSNTSRSPDTIGGHANFVLSHLADEGIMEFHLLGHSMGGMIVQEMIAIAPERIKKLVLYGTASTGDLPGRFETFETSKQRVSDDGVVASARRISSTWFREYQKAAEFENCAKLAEQSSPQAMLAALDAMKAWDRSDNLQEISCPTLIIWGEQDRAYRWPQIHDLWSGIPDVSLAVMPGCSHAAHMEKANLFNAIVGDFIGT